MKIVEYNHELAQQVADMWNKSGDNWGSDTSVKTKEDVINEESKSGNIKLYLAMDNNEVVGYCSFSEYQHDEGASYLPLLNVRPDYHGKKVGKKLILKVIEDAVKEKWPRFDLFTWSGNIKAMPLYKKCGFFWEKNASSVHLMNFIPYIYKTEALKDYLSQIDWYKDSKRVIDMNQDGEDVNGFDIFKYHFKNEETDLKFEFEKSGRGLKLIETPDYLIEMTVDEHKLVFDQTYNVTFKLVNKSTKPLEITLEGVNNKNIISEYKETYLVENELIVNKPFTVNKATKKQDKFRTYPVVESNVYVNGLKSVFKMGIDSKHPLFTELHVKEYNHILNETYEAYLNVENNLKETTTFDITLPNNHIEVLSSLNITLDPKEKRSITFKYKMKEFGFMNGDAVISYNGSKMNHKVTSLFKGHEGIIKGESEDGVSFVNGNYTVWYDKHHNRFNYSDKFYNEPVSAFMTPQIGLPYSLEFSKLEASFNYVNETTLKATLTSRDFEDVYLHSYMENNKGILRVYFELENKGPKRNLALSLPIFKSFRDTVVPYDNRLLETTMNEGGGIGSINGTLIDENWLYDNKTKTGLSWDKDINVIVSGWRLSANLEDITLEQGETFKTGNFYMSFVHESMKSFRRFAGQFTKKEKTKFIELHIENDNPFIKESTTVRVSNKRKLEFNGTLSTDLDSVDLKEELKLYPGLNHIKLDTTDKVINYKKYLFNVFGEISKTKEDASLVVQNGLITFKASEKYSDALYSLTFNNNEWLDTNYPQPKERAWWGSFVGGINTRYEGVQGHIVLEEPRTAEFVTLKDNLGNNWEGIKTTVNFVNSEDYKGLYQESYFLTLPGVPVLHSFTKVTNNTGKLINNKWISAYNVLQLDVTNKKASFDFDGVTYKCGDAGISKNIKKLVQFSSSREYKLGIYNKECILETETQKDYTMIFSDKKHIIPDQTSVIHPGDFYVFTKEELKAEYLKDLENIKFEV